MTLFLLTLDFDVTEDASMERARSLVDSLLSENADMCLWSVVNNAAMLVFAAAEWQTPAQIKMQLAVNAAGPLIMTQKLLPLLRTELALFCHK